MQVATSVLILGLTASVCACDKSELADLTGQRSYFIYASENFFATEVTNIESFDLKVFLHFLEFENTSLTLPLIIHPGNHAGKSFLSYEGSVSCDINSKFEFITEIFTSSPNKTITGILYGCELYYNNQIRFIIYDNTRWSKKEILNKCQKSSEVSAKYVSKMNRCLQEFKDYSQKCLKITINDKFKGVDMIFGGGLLLISILFVACIAHKYYKSITLSN